MGIRSAYVALRRFFAKASPENYREIKAGKTTIYAVDLRVYDQVTTVWAKDEQSPSWLYENGDFVDLWTSVDIWKLVTPIWGESNRKMRERELLSLIEEARP